MAYAGSFIIRAITSVDDPHVVVSGCVDRSPRKAPGSIAAICCSVIVPSCPR